MVAPNYSLPKADVSRNTGPQCIGVGYRWQVLNLDVLRVREFTRQAMAAACSCKLPRAWHNPVLVGPAGYLSLGFVAG